MSRLTTALTETLNIFEAAPPGTPLTTSEIAERLDLGRRSTYERLERLVDEGALETKKVGANGRIWWRSPNDPAVTLTVTEAADRSAGPANADHQATNANTIPADEILDTAEVGVFILDASFDVVWVNATAERYFGLDRAAAIHRDKRALVAEQLASLMEDSESFAQRVLATYEDNTSTEQFECRVTASENRTERWLEYRSTPIESGPYAGGRIEVYYDITDRKYEHTEARLLSSVSCSIPEAETLEDGVQALLADVCEWTDWEVGQAWIPTEEDDDVAERLPASYVTDEEFTSFERASRNYTFELGEGIPGRVLEMEELVWFPDVSAVSESVYPRTSLAADVGLRAGLGVPVIADGEIAVILEFYMAQRREKTEWLVETVTSVAAKFGNLVTRRQSDVAHRQKTELITQILETSPVGIAVFDDHRKLEGSTNASRSCSG